MAVTELYDVVVVGAGAAGLQAATRIVQQLPSLKILILEKNVSSGGRICDINLAEGIEAVGLGAWKIDSRSSVVLKLCEENGVELLPWDVHAQWMEVDGRCFGSVSDAISQVFPSIKQESPLSSLEPSMVPQLLQDLVSSSLPSESQSTCLEDLIIQAIGKNEQRLLSLLSHGYKAIAKYDIDILSTLQSAKAGSHSRRPRSGMSTLIEILEKQCSERGAIINHCALVKHITRISTRSSPDPTYEIAYVRLKSGSLPRTDFTAYNYVEGGSPLSITKIQGKSVVIAIPPKAITRLVPPSLTNPEDDILSSLLRNPFFRSTSGLPAFRAVALYNSAWWNDSDRHCLPPLRPHGSLRTLSSRLSMIMAYAGSGPNGEVALHLSYCDDFDARCEEGGFWHDCVCSALSDDKLNIEGQEDGDRSKLVDEKMYEFVRSELSKAFVRPMNEIPLPLKFEWRYWDDGAVHLQKLVPSEIETLNRSISRESLEAWATSGPISVQQSTETESRTGTLHSQEHIVLCGEGFAADWGWVEGALRTGAKAGAKVVEWLG